MVTTYLLGDAGGPPGVSFMLGALLMHVVFVAAPSYVPLALAPPGIGRGVMLLVLLGAAIWASHVLAVDSVEAVLYLFFVPTIAVPLAGLAWFGRVAAEAHARTRALGGAATRAPASVPLRLAALTVDVIVLIGALVVALVLEWRGLHGARRSWVYVALAYLPACGAARGRSPGQVLVGLTVVDVRTGRRLGPLRSAVRGLVLAVEVALAVTGILLPVAITDVALTAPARRSFADKLVGSVVTAPSWPAPRFVPCPWPPPAHQGR